MRQHYLQATPTRTLRGALCHMLGSGLGTVIWLLIGLGTAALCGLLWCWAQIAEQLDGEFDEAHSLVWWVLVVLGLCTATVTALGLWPAITHAWHELTGGTR